MTKVLIVEDQRMMREMMETYVRQTEGYSLVGSLPDAKASERFCASNAVDLVLMDVCTEMGVWQFSVLAVADDKTKARPRLHPNKK